MPVSELVPVLMNHLPLREDMDEYEVVFKALNVLYSAGSIVQFCGAVFHNLTRNS